MRVEYYLTVSAILFSIGIFGVITRRNAIAILMSIELLLNAVNINLVAFSHYWGTRLTRAAFTSQEEILSPVGQSFAVFVIIIAAAEAAIGLAIVIALYRRRETVFVEDVNTMKW